VYSLIRGLISSKGLLPLLQLGVDHQGYKIVNTRTRGRVRLELTLA
jgi:hypothetical protein